MLFNTLAAIAFTAVTATAAPTPTDDSNKRGIMPMIGVAPVQALEARGKGGYCDIDEGYYNNKKVQSQGRWCAGQCIDMSYDCCPVNGQGLQGWCHAAWHCRQKTDSDFEDYYCAGNPGAASAVP